MEKEFPSYTIGYDRDCRDVFLDVLKNHNDAHTNEILALNEYL